MSCWLMKSEPTSFSIDDLKKAPARKTYWDGVRNYQARNMMRDEMKKGDRVFFYHSNCSEPGIVGIMEVVREAYPDPTAFDPASDHFDARSDPQNPRWFMVDVKYVRHTHRVIPLAELKQQEALKNMPLVKRGNRLSVMPVTEDEWKYILALEKQEA